MNKVSLIILPTETKKKNINEIFKEELCGDSEHGDQASDGVHSPRESDEDITELPELERVVSF